MTKAQGTYQRHWKKYQLWYLFLISSPILFISAGLLLPEMFKAFGLPDWFELYGQFILGIFVIPIAYAQYYTQFFSCPRCGDYFFGNSFEAFSNLNLQFTHKECPHCGLEKFASHSWEKALES